jgi:hypothetical protein
VNLGNKLELLYCDILLHKYSKELQKVHDIHSSFLQIRIVSGSVLACSTQASCASFFGFAGGTDTTVSWLDKDVSYVVVVAVMAAWPALTCLPISLYSNLGK